MPSQAPWPETPDVCDNGNGPAIRGTRLVMTDIYQTLNGRTPEWVAEFYRLPVEKVRAAAAYIDANRERVEADVRAIRERAARGNPPEVEAKLARNREKLYARKRELEAQSEARAAAAGGGLDPRAAG
jgi:uncharacterized protein (DUF433 family)